MIDFTSYRPAPAAGSNVATGGSIFGNGSSIANARSEKPKAKTWLNIGSVARVQQADGTIVEQFVSAIGVPLDTAQPKALKGTGAFRQLLQAENKLLGKFQQLAADLQPGEDIIVEGPNGLAFQFRHVRGDEPLPQDAAENPFDINFEVNVSE